MIGVLSGGTMNASLGQVVTRHVRLQGITVGNRDDFEAMSRAMAQHRLQPIIDREFAFDELMSALEYLRSGQHFGKVCVVNEHDLHQDLVAAVQAATAGEIYLSRRAVRF